jgi:hypothetical protein
MRWFITAAGFMLLVPAAAHQDVALKELMPKGMVVGVAISQRQFALRIELKGNLAAMLAATVQSKRAPETEALSLQVSVVAGARNQLNLDFARAAA